MDARPADENEPDRPDRRPRQHGSGRHIVFLDEQHARPAHPYTPEGEIRMMGDLAAGLSRRGGMRPVALLLLGIIALPIVLSLIVILTHQL